MFITPHFLTGAAIAVAIDKPELAVPLALASHFVLDAIPHRDTIGEEHITPENLLLKLVDGFTALFLFFLFVPSGLRIYAFLIGAVALLPDIIALPTLIWPRLKKGILAPFQRFHVDFLQSRFPDTIDWFWGLATQVVIVAADLVIISMR